MMGFYFLLAGIVIGSIILGLIITFALVKLMFLLYKWYSFKFGKQKAHETRGERNQTNEAFGFIIFLKCIYYFLHLNEIRFVFRYPFRKRELNTEVEAVYSKHEYKRNSENYDGSPKPIFHKATISQPKQGGQPKGNDTRGRMR